MNFQPNIYGPSKVELRPHPTRGELMGVLPLLDGETVPSRYKTGWTFTNSMTRGEWSKLGYKVRQRQEPTHKELRKYGRYFGGQWHPWYVGVYTGQQAVLVEQYEAEQRQRETDKATAEQERRAREETKLATEHEWSIVQSVAKLKDKVRCIYTYLLDRAKSEVTDTVITNNDELRAECKIKRNDLKGYRDELVDLDMINYRLTAGRQSKITIKALQGG